VRNLPVLQQNVRATLEERAQDSLRSGRARGFCAVQHPHIAKMLMPVDNESRSRGVAEPFAAI
jgi:hypothetical protein